MLPVLDLLRWLGLGGATPPLSCTPQIDPLNEGTRAQAGLGEQTAGISFSKTLLSSEVNVHSVDLPHSDVGRQVMIIHLGEVVCSGSCRVPGMGHSCFHQAGCFSPLEW